MQVLRILASFVVASFVAQQLGPDGKGALALVQQVPTIVALAVGLGFGGVNIYYVGSGRRTAEEAFTDSAVLLSIAAGIGLPLAVLVMRLLPALEGIALQTMVLAALAVPVGAFSSQLAGILVGVGRPQWQARAQSVSSLVQIAGVGALFFTNTLTVDRAIAVTLVAGILSIVIMLAALRPRALVPGVRGRFIDAMPYARKRYWMEIAFMIEMRVDIVMLGMLAGTTAIGVYSIAVSLVELLWVLPQAAETPLLARLLKEGERTGTELTALATRLIVWLQLFMLVGAALLLKPAVGLVFGASFSGAVPLFWILAPGVVLNGLVGPVNSYLVSRGHLFSGLAAFTVASNVVLNALLIPHFDASGAAIASTVTYALGSAWLMARFVRETACPVSRLLLPRISDLKALTGRWI